MTDNPLETMMNQREQDERFVRMHLMPREGGYQSHREIGSREGTGPDRTVELQKEALACFERLMERLKAYERK